MTIYIDSLVTWFQVAVNNRWHRTINAIPAEVMLGKRKLRRFADNFGEESFKECVAKEKAELKKEERELAEELTLIQQAYKANIPIADVKEFEHKSDSYAMKNCFSDSRSMLDETTAELKRRIQVCPVVPAKLSSCCGN